ncbi:fungal-specific transcription factor domain-domain-containing protein [Kockovaella imperatae]|uniref:Fungal-specific transcription factor domain-domain-containing protein n=1 Tax=Kockovaella imperatae TaxID=4999 RepID=A0A1Y1USJ9_9TREE|nr:fungal-specific transcription factor domain-domain-containing protein [Kockovaella imperatae]ORX40990.1 fungal-specific transcription factor domain-domain-containing protein [Kockovaella imperatae]
MYGNNDKVISNDYAMNVSGPSTSDRAAQRTSQSGETHNATVDDTRQSDQQSWFPSMLGELPGQSMFPSHPSQRQPSVDSGPAHTSQRSHQTSTSVTSFSSPEGTLSASTSGSRPAQNGKLAKAKATAIAPEATNTTKKKKKRKSGEVPNSGGGDADGDKEKRIKTGRACDACRTKKIRCDILPSTTSPGGRESQQICAHCKQCDLECTWFLPITETRFKKRKTMEDSNDASFNLKASATSSPGPATPREVPARTEGPTSLSFLLHTALPANATAAYDLRQHNRWEVSEDGNGLIRVSVPPLLNGNEDVEDLTRGYNRLARPTLNAATISSLVNADFDHIAPLFPIVLRCDFAAKTNPSPLLLYAICGLGSTRREFPRELFAGVRGMINGLLRSNDILSDARFEHVQALLLLAQAGDLHAQPTAATASACLIRLASAIRMAQDLGLHRESSSRAQTVRDLAFVELRRRVWATCVILDRWYAAALGIPLLVDLLDCDILLPAPYEILPDSEPSSWRIDPSYLYLAEHLKLAILIGRVLKTIYSPTGLKHTSDEQLRNILDDLANWQRNLPNDLKFRGNSDSPTSGLLHIARAALKFLFWRVFLRITYVVPPHLQLRIQVADWTDMVQNAAEAIQWLSSNDSVLDTIFVFAYTLTSCALVHYHTWARRKDPVSLEMLRLVRDTAQRWEEQVQPDQMSLRRKTCEIMTLLHEAALKTNPEDNGQHLPAPVNPTPGVSARSDVSRVAWVKDNEMPGTGFWVARSDEDRRAGGVIAEAVILLEDLKPHSDAHRKAQRALGILDEPEPRPGPGPSANDPFASIEMSDLPAEMQAIANTANVNPQINEKGVDPFSGQPGPDWTSWSLPSNPVQEVLNLGTLDTLPMSSFDFPSWEQYFTAINSAVSPERETFGQLQPIDLRSHP